MKTEKEIREDLALHRKEWNKIMESDEDNLPARRIHAMSIEVLKWVLDEEEK